MIPSVDLAPSWRTTWEQFWKGQRLRYQRDEMTMSICELEAKNVFSNRTMDKAKGIQVER